MLRIQNIKVGYQVFLTFNNGESEVVDLENTIFNDTRKIFQPLRDLDYLKSFKIRFNTIPGIIKQILHLNFSLN